MCVSETDFINKILLSWHYTRGSFSYFKYRTYYLQARRMSKGLSKAASLRLSLALTATKQSPALSTTGIHPKSLAKSLVNSEKHGKLWRERSEEQKKKGNFHYLFIFHFSFWSHLTGLLFSSLLSALLCLPAENQPQLAFCNLWNKKNLLMLLDVCDVYTALKLVSGFAVIKVSLTHQDRFKQMYKQTECVFISVFFLTLSLPYEKHPPTIFKIITLW